MTRITTNDAGVRSVDIKDVVRDERERITRARQGEAEVPAERCMYCEARIMATGDPDFPWRHTDARKTDHDDIVARALSTSTVAQPVNDGGEDAFPAFDKRVCPSISEQAQRVHGMLKPEAWHCQACGHPLIFEGNTYSCNICEQTWPAVNIALFAYADLTDESFLAAIIQAELGKGEDER